MISSLIINQDMLIDLADKMPTTLNQCISSTSKHKWKEFTVRTKCHTLYSGYESSQTDNLCSHVEYPDHPHKSFRKPCGNNLFKKKYKLKVKKLLTLF